MTLSEYENVSFMLLEFQNYILDIKKYFTSLKDMFKKDQKISQQINEILGFCESFKNNISKLRINYNKKFKPLLENDLLKKGYTKKEIAFIDSYNKLIEKLNMNNLDKKNTLDLLKLLLEATIQLNNLQAQKGIIPGISLQVDYEILLDRANDKFKFTEEELKQLDSSLIEKKLYESITDYKNVNNVRHWLKDSSSLFSYFQKNFLH